MRLNSVLLLQIVSIQSALSGQGNAVIILPIHTSTYLIHEGSYDSKSAAELLDEGRPYNKAARVLVSLLDDSISTVVVPVNLNSCHWAVLAFVMSSSQFFWMDSMVSCPSGHACTFACGTGP